MRTLIGSFLTLVVAACLSGCGPRDAVYDPSHFRLRGVLVPSDVVLPRGTPPGDVANGLYTESASDRGVGLCCFVAPRTRLVVRKSRPASLLRIAIYVPNVPLFALHPQHFSISFPAFGETIKSGALLAGFHMLSVKVPPALRTIDGNVRVNLDAAIDYVPKDAGTGSDARHYAAIVSSIYFE